ncbi:hypothetical protein BC936DRAFT_136670 [Jimgerdemannia flammicorona]|uniref:Dynactin subunit 6 n=1 Tax=Jimgerdemannia flammicorona TaxID=994334 RepID=A0A433DJL1_9FUNG|nr:hypothetical protein BC936DRAFT_136670 [Jimgerdemannia flammicorona]
MYSKLDAVSFQDSHEREHDHRREHCLPTFSIPFAERDTVSLDIEGSKIGDCNIVEAKARILNTTSIGDNCVIGTGCSTEIHETVPDNTVIYGYNHNRRVQGTINTVSPEVQKLGGDLWRMNVGCLCGLLKSARPTESSLPIFMGSSIECAQGAPRQAFGLPPRVYSSIMYTSIISCFGHLFLVLLDIFQLLFEHRNRKSELRDSRYFADCRDYDRGFEPFHDLDTQHSQAEARFRSEYEESSKRSQQ